MTVAVDLTPEVERRLADLARARHQGVSEFLRALIERAVAGGGDLPFWVTATEAEWQKEFRDWADSHDDLPILPDEALTRESIYGHRASVPSWLTPTYCSAGSSQDRRNTNRLLRRLRHCD